MLADVVVEESSNQSSNEKCNGCSDHCCNANSSTCADCISCAEGGRFTICKNANNIEKLVVDVRTTTIGHNNSPLMDNNNKNEEMAYQTVS